MTTNNSEHETTTTTATGKTETKIENKEEPIISKDDSKEKSNKDLPLPKDNRVYGKKEYWDERFEKEEEFEWLVSYEDLAPQILPYLTEASSEAGEQDTNNKNSINSNPRMLLIGVGNSPFSADLYDAGWENQLNIDYSPVVIDAMRAKHQSTRPKMEWQVMDMTDMSALPNESYDVVIDKAAMDAIMTHEGDVWNPDDSVVAQARAMCQHISRILKPGGYHLHISFAQPHFRKKYLLGLHNPPNEFDILRVSPNDGTYSEEFRWSLQVETIRGDKNDGCFHHFLYIMQKSSS